MEEVSAKCQHHPVISSEMKDELQCKSNHKQHGSNLYFINKGFQIKIEIKNILLTLFRPGFFLLPGPG